MNLMTFIETVFGLAIGLLCVVSMLALGDSVMNKLQAGEWPDKIDIALVVLVWMAVSYQIVRVL